MLIRGIEFTTDEICTAFMEMLEETKEEMFEKNFIVDDEIRASVFVIWSSHAAELTGLVREWAHKIGMRRER